MNHRILLVLALALQGFGCANAEDVMPGDWDLSDGGTLTLDDDGTGNTDGPFFIGSICSHDGSVISEFGLEWTIVDDPEVVKDNFGWRPDEAALARFETELGCTLGEGMIEEPLLSVSNNQVEFGFDALAFESVFQVLTRQ